MSNAFDEFDKPANAFDEFDGPAKPALKRTALDTIGDIGVSAVKGAIAVPEFAVGIADIATGGRVGKALENEGGAIGFRPKEANAALDELYSPAQQAANKEVADAKGFFPTAGAMLQNPSTIGQAIVQSLPAMGAGGLVGRGVMAAAPGVGRILGIGAGEGIVGAGLRAESTRQQTADGLLTPKQSLLAAGSGAVNAAITAGSGRVANRLGIGDIDQMILTGQMGGAAAKKGMIRRAGEGALTEGVLEEAPQSASEQALQNIALDRPVGEGVGSATAQGMLTGGLTGAAVGPFVSGPQTEAKPAPKPKPSAPLKDASAPEAGFTPTPGDAIRATAPEVIGPLTGGLSALAESQAKAVDAAIPTGDAQELTGQAALKARRESDLAQFAADNQGAATLGSGALDSGFDTRELSLEEVAALVAPQDTKAQPIPTGTATELPLETVEPTAAPDPQREPRTPKPQSTRGMTDADVVKAYVEQRRTEGTLAGRRFAGDFDAGRIKPEDVLALVRGRKEPTPDERLAAAAAQAPKPRTDGLLDAEGKAIAPTKEISSNAETRNARTLKTAGVQGLDGNASQMQQPQWSALAPVRGQRDKSVSSMGRLPDVLEGYGGSTKLQTQHRQIPGYERELRTDQLSMGNGVRAGGKQADEQIRTGERGAANADASSKSPRDVGELAVGEVGKRNAAQRGSGESKSERPEGRDTASDQRPNASDKRNGGAPSDQALYAQKAATSAGVDAGSGGVGNESKLTALQGRRDDRVPRSGDDSSQVGGSPGAAEKPGSEQVLRGSSGGTGTVGAESTSTTPKVTSSLSLLQLRQAWNEAAARGDDAEATRINDLIVAAKKGPAAGVAAQPPKEAPDGNQARTQANAQASPEGPAQSPDAQGLLTPAPRTLKERRAAEKEQSDGSVARAIRKAVEDVPSRIVGSWHPVTVSANGRTQVFMSNIKRVVSDGKGPQAISLQQIRPGRLMAGDPLRPLVYSYKLNRANELVEEGIPREPSESEASRWKNAFEKNAPINPPQTPPREAPTQRAGAAEAAETAAVPGPADAGVEAARVGKDRQSLEEKRQMVADMIATKKANREAVPDAWVKRLADLSAELRGEVTDSVSVYSLEVPGHPLFDGPPVLRNLVPIKVNTAADAQRALDRALELERSAATEFYGARQALKVARTAAEKKAAQDRVTKLNNQGWDEDALKMLRDETIAELSRLVDAAPTTNAVAPDEKAPPTSRVPEAVAPPRRPPAPTIQVDSAGNAYVDGAPAPTTIRERREKKAVDDAIAKLEAAISKEEAAPTPAVTVEDAPEVAATDKESLTVAPATHKDPGEPAEVATPAVVAEAIKTGVQVTERKPSAMKSELLAEIDQAVKDAPDYMEFQSVVKTMGLKDATASYTSVNDRAALGEKTSPKGYSRPTRTFKVEGDGIFTVQNTVRQLLTFRAKVESSPGFRDRQPRAGLTERATDALDRRSTDAAIANMLDEGDFQAALDFAEAKDVDLANVKLTKVLRDRLDKWQKEQESAKRMTEYQAAQAEGKPAPGSLAAMMADQEQAAPAAENQTDDIPEAGIASQTFEQWAKAKYAGNEYKAKYLEEFDGNEQRATLAAAIGTIDNDRTTADLLRAAKQQYRSDLFQLPREASISLDVWDALDNMAKVDAQRHFYDLDTRITRRTQDETKARVAAETVKKAPYEAAFAEVDAEIRRLDKIDGPVTQKQKDLSARRDRLREAIYQIGQGKEPDGRLLKSTPTPPVAQPATTAAPRDMLPPSTTQEATTGAKRTRPRGTIVFKRPIVGKDGNRLVAYSWQWKPFEYVDSRGEERVARVSDWDNSETSAETGREVVHQFTVDVDGKDQTVSAEGALRLLGFMDGAQASGFKSIASAAKTLARLKMQQAELESARDAFNADMAAVNAMPLPAMPTAPGKRGTMEGWWALGDAEVRQLEPGSLLPERKRLLISEWRNNRMKERGGWRNASMRAEDFATNLSLLQKRIDKQQAKIDALAEAEAAPVAQSATTPPIIARRMEAEQAAQSETTEAQRQQSADHAKDLGGRVVWQRGDIALIEGYSLLSGDSVYIAANGSQRTRVDIRSYTGSGYTEAQKAELLKARADAVKAAEDALARNPDGPFKAGPLVFADDIPASVQGVVRGWINLLGLDGARIVVTTPKSGAEMADGLAGKFRRIGKANLSGDNTNGTMQPLGGDDFHIAVRPNVSTLKTMEVLAHELGHIVERRAFAKADAATQQAIRDAHSKWLRENGSGRALDMAQAMRAYRSGQTTGFNDDAKAAEAGAYWRSFGEWFADQVSRWSTTQDKPVGVVEQFFKRLADRLRTFFTGERAKFKPDATVAQWLDSLSKDVAPVPEVAAQSAAEPVKAKPGELAPMPAVGGISMSLAQQAHSGTSFSPERRAEQERDSFRGALQDAWQRAAKVAGSDPAAVARITEVFQDIADGYRARYTATLQARSRVMSTMITGGANFPVARNRKRMETERKRADEASEYLTRGIKRLLRAARGPIDNSPESELERVRLNLSQREEAQDTMKAANVALRKGDDAALEDLGFTAEQIAELKKPDFAGRKGFPDYKLTNNNAEIRRLRERLKSAEERMQDAAAGPVETERAGVKIVEDATDDRLRLVFDGKPSEAVREDLKAGGFKWSPKNEAWQRQLTDNARYAAKQVLDKHYPAADDGARFSRRGLSPEQRAANFNEWSGGAEVVDREAALTRGFKTGESVVVEAYHGTARPDRVGEVFDRKRATSGPMAFSTSDPVLASSYAMGKEDTSIGQEYDGDYSQWFKVKTPGQRERDVVSSWWYLTPEQRNRITDLAPRVVSKEDDDGHYSIELASDEHTNGVGSYEYELRKSRNPLRALVESWLSSGFLFNDEQTFMQVLKAAGFPMSQVEFDSPRAKYPFVYKTFISMGNPLVTSDIPPATMRALEDAAKRDRSRASAGGADQWDKNTRTLREWVAQLKDPERGTYAWTSIPDKVTEVLKAQGYDGVIDWSGKGGGDIVAPVYVPFSETQIKSALGNKGTFDPNKRSILFSRSRGRGVSMRDAEALKSRIRAVLPQAPEIRLVESIDEVPPRLQEEIRKEGAEDDLEAVYYEGIVYGFPNHWESLERGEFVMGHHEIRHHGMRVLYMDKDGGLKALDSKLLELHRQNPALQKAAQAIKDSGRAGQKETVKAIEEALADMPAEQVAALTGWDKFIAAIRDMLRAFARRLRNAGLTSAAKAIEPTAWTDRDVAAFVLQSEKVSGKGAGGARFSRSAMKDIDANIRRGTDAMNRAILEKSDQHRAMFRNGMGWVDFVWGDDKRGLAHVYKQRMEKDGMSRDAVTGMLTSRVVETIATGTELRRREIGGSVRAVLALGDQEAILVRNKGSNTWLLNGWKVSPGANVPANDSNDATHVSADSSDGNMGAGDDESVARLSRPTTLAERRAAREDNFARWFAGSKVVDAQGKPLVVYHGTRNDVAAFAPDKVKGRFPNSEGFYFTSRPQHAAAYADSIQNAAEDFNPASRFAVPVAEGANVMPAYVSLQNPKVVTVSAWGTLESRVDGDGGAMVRAAREAGHDGVIVKREAGDEWDGMLAIAFRPEQIKSATGNNGDYSPSNPDIRFSRAAAPGMAQQRQGPQRLSAQDLVNAKGGVFDFNRLGETKQDRIRTVIDASRPGWLGLLTRDQIADVYGAEIPPVKEYDQLTRLMENERSKIAQDADDLYSEWAKIPAEQNDTLARVMLDATVFGVDPDGDFTPGKPNDAERQQVHARIKAQFDGMSPEAQAMYGKVKSYHLALLNKLREALEARIQRQVESGATRAAALTKIREAFDSYLGSGPYFPLSRFGDFLVVANREEDGERVVASYATSGEQAAAARVLESDGFTVKLKTAKTYSRETDGSAGKFIGDVLMTLDKLDMSEATVGGNAENLKAKLMDDVNQLFIRALPDLSYRKHFMHRKGTPGFSSDMMRGFASSAFHAASHIARLNHADQMTFALQDAYTAIEQAPEGDFNLHSQVLNELTKRHDASLNPNTHPVAAMLNQVGFVMYLGLSPAAGLVNMLQTVMVTMPHLGARYGFGKANSTLAAALSDIMGAKANAKNGWNAAQSPKLSAEERAMMTQLQEEGVIDLTQAHDLASATGLDTGNVARSKAAFAMARAMKIVGWTFHIPEVMNRQVTALSAYRLEMRKSGNAEAAADAAREAIKRTHFDYSASNRARFMQGNLARVVLQFRQYSQNMTYLLGRAMHQALKGESPEVRQIARRQLLATVGVTWAMAGALGLPGLGAVGGLIGILVGALGDDEEPWEWKVELRNLLADQFGKETAEVLSHGIPRALMPWDISNRVSLGDLWWRDNGREGQSPREAFASDMANILGPTAGTALGLYTMADHAAKGNWSKAAESIVPKFLRDPLKAIREGSDGVTSGRGEPLMDVTAAEVTGRLLGFAPARVSEMYEGKGAVMNAKTAIEEKRQMLVGRMAKARLDRDAEAAAELSPQIAAFNERNPEFRITLATIAKSMRAKAQNRARTDEGILLPRTKENLREIGRFAVTQ